MDQEVSWQQAHMFGPWFGQKQKSSSSSTTTNPKVASSNTAPQPKPSYRVRSYEISQEKLAQALQDGVWYRKAKYGMPADAEIVSSEWNIDRSTFRFRVLHPSFDEVPEGDQPPTFYISVTEEPLPKPEPQQRSNRGYEFL